MSSNLDQELLRVEEPIDCRMLNTRCSRLAIVAWFVFVLARVGIREELRMDDFLFYWVLIVPFSTLAVFAMVWGRAQGLARRKYSVRIALTALGR